MIFLYPGNLDEKTLARIRSALSGFSVCMLSDSCKNRTMKEITEAGAAKEVFSNDTSSGAPVVYMKDMDRDAMSRVHDALISIDPQILFAAATQDNSLWTLNLLMEELSREREWFTAWNRLEKLIQESPKSPYFQNADYQKGLMMAISAYQQAEPPLELLIAACEFLENPEGR